MNIRAKSVLLAINTLKMFKIVTFWLPAYYMQGCGLIKKEASL